MAAAFVMALVALGVITAWLVLPFSLGAAAGCVLITIGLAFFAGLLAY